MRTKLIILFLVTTSLLKECNCKHKLTLGKPEPYSVKQVRCSKP